MQQSKSLIYLNYTFKKHSALFQTFKFNNCLIFNKLIYQINNGFRISYEFNCAKNLCRVERGCATRVSTRLIVPWTFGDETNALSLELHDELGARCKKWNLFLI